MSVIFCIILVLFTVIIILSVISMRKNDDEEEMPASSHKQQHPSQNPKQLSAAELEAIRQADEAFDWKTHNAIVNGTYTGPLPDYDGAYWTRIYPDLYHTKIAGINFCRGIKNLAGVYFDALLIPEPNNKYDPNAIKIVYADDRRKLGYIPADETEAVRLWVKNQFPYPCRAHIDEFEEWDDELERDRTFLKGEINIKRNTSPPNVSPNKS